MKTRVIDWGELGIEREGQLWLAGQVPAGPRVAIVGARAARGVFRRAVPVLVEVAGQGGWSVVSGGALGIDGDVHKAALRERVAQLAVLPLGADVPYPPDHFPLFQRIADTGDSGVLFARPPGTEATRGMFASRNKTIVELSQRLLVVQAGLRSGSIRSGRLALKAGLPTAVILGSPGAAALVGEGATGLSWNAREPGNLARAFAAWLEGTATTAAVWPTHLSLVEERFTELGRGWISIDDFDDPIQAAASLVEAETLGLLVEAGPGRWCSTSRPELRGTR